MECWMDDIREEASGIESNHANLSNSNRQQASALPLPLQPSETPPVMDPVFRAQGTKFVHMCI